MSFTVYKFFDAENELLYVGITGTGMKRLEQHQRLKEWWPKIARAEFVHFETRATAEAEEVRLILSLRPQHNLKLAPTVPEGMDSVEALAKWLRFKDSNTIRGLVAEGLLPVTGYTARGVPYFDRDKVDAWVAEGKAARLPDDNWALTHETGSKPRSKERA